MNRLLPVTLLATIAFGVPELVRTAQGGGLFVVVADGTGQRGGFQPDSQPRDVANTIVRVSVFLPQKDVRLPDGQIVTGFGFDGWIEGEGVRVVVSALLPADGTNRYVEMKKGMRPIFRKQEFVKFTLRPGEKRLVEEMKPLGIEPLVLRLDTKQMPVASETPDISRFRVAHLGLESQRPKNARRSGRDSYANGHRSIAGTADPMSAERQDHIVRRPLDSHTNQRR